MTDTKPSKGLIVADPWMELILSGEKTWEMRSRATGRRGLIALLRRGHVVGYTHLVGVLPALKPEAYAAGFHYHRIPPERHDAAIDGGWLVPWLVASTVRLQEPIPYAHPRGAVTWVTLTAENAPGLHGIGHPD